MKQHTAADYRATGVGIRHLQCLLLFLALCVAFMMRVNLSVAIVAMMDRNATNSDFPEYDWSERTKSLILSSFFWGYCITQIPGGQLAHKFGGKVLLLYSIGISGVLAIFTPLSAQLGGWQLVCTIRLLQGLSQGVIFPSTHTLLAKWAPPAERGVLGTCCYSGSQFGSILMLGVSGALAASEQGWPSIFRLSGYLSLLWVMAFFLYGADEPAQCKSISESERLYIEKSTMQSPSPPTDNPGRSRTPWRRILSSRPVLVLLLAQCAHNWGYWTLLTQTPSYMKGVLCKDIKSNALLSALPYAANLLLGLACCALASALESRRLLHTNTSRKLFNTIGQWTPALALVALGFVSAERSDLAVAILTVTVGTNAASFLGFFINHIDLSPNYAGILMGISNCAANVVSVIAPLVVGIVIDDVTNPLQWRTIFCIAGGVYFVGNLLFITLGSTVIQSWNSTADEGKLNENMKNRDHVKFKAVKTCTI